ncbi:MAG: DNA methyltransferase [Candidatus Pacearchaeota archaeon]
MKYIFILGRNPELSEAEITSFLMVRGIKILERDLKINGLFLELDGDIRKEELEFLGGTIAIGKVVSECKKKELDLKLKSIYSGKKNNITYAIWNFSDSETYEYTLSYLKSRFSDERLKASRKNLTGNLELQNGKKINIVGNNLDEEFFVFGKYFGKIFFNTDYKSLEFRDMSKPHKRESLTISPRLAKIMINLSETKKGEKLADCFCGVGSIMAETLLQGIKAVGIDKDKSAIEMARKNLEWMKFDKKDYELINGDSLKIKIQKVQSIASEPELGEILRETPPKEKALRIINGYENLMINVLRNMKSCVEKRFVFTAPYIMTSSGRVSCNTQKIAEKSGLKLIGSYKEFRKEQIVGREIFILSR